MENNVRKLKNAYGFDDVSIKPGEITINPELTDTSMKLLKSLFLHQLWMQFHLQHSLIS
jgi:IMP dehydrogenase/GMP reductase